MRKKYKHILVPLDGTDFAEQALVDAFSLAQLSQAQVTLLQVIVPMEHSLDPDVFDPPYIAKKEDEYKAQSQQYLSDVCVRMGVGEIAVRTEADVGSPAQTIVDYARRHSVDLIVMATHGRGGLRRWTEGSVAETVLHGTDVPVLLVCVRSS